MHLNDHVLPPLPIRGRDFRPRADHPFFHYDPPSPAPRSGSCSARSAPVCATAAPAPVRTRRSARSHSSTASAPPSTPTSTSTWWCSTASPPVRRRRPLRRGHPLLRRRRLHLSPPVLQRRVLRLFRRRGLLESHTVDDMLTWPGTGGFSLDASVRIHGSDRAGRERLLRYCARPPFALDRLRIERELGDQDRRAEGRANPDPSRSRGVRPILSRPRVHPAMAAPFSPSHPSSPPGPLTSDPAAPGPPPPLPRACWPPTHGSGHTSSLSAERERPRPLKPAALERHPPAQDSDDSFTGAAARSRWAQLLARIYEVFPLRCPECGSDMRILAFLTDPEPTGAILPSPRAACRPTTTVSGPGTAAAGIRPPRRSRHPGAGPRTHRRLRPDARLRPGQARPRTRSSTTIKPPAPDGEVPAGRTR